MVKNVLVVGGGFAGLTAAQAFSPKQFSVTLLDPKPCAPPPPLFPLPPAHQLGSASAALYACCCCQDDAPGKPAA
jgi:NADH dehydrogenase FAD-containing subunit